MEVPELKHAIREKILESYRNGQQAGHSPAPRATPKVRNGKNDHAPQRFTGDWQCAKCGEAITSLPFEPKGKSAGRLLCLECYKKSREGE
jgi:CxxC-x17-CxxC domain-containing protein